MEILDYIEEQARRNGEMRLEALETLNKRAHTGATLLLGGAGALGAFGLAQLDKSGPFGLGPVLLAVAIWCAGISLWIVLRCLRSQKLFPLANEPKTLFDYIDGETAAKGGDEVAALKSARRAELMRQQVALDGYSLANGAVANALDRAYVATALIPVVALVFVLIVQGLRRCFH